MKRLLLPALLALFLPMAVQGQGAAAAARADSILSRVDAGRIQGSPNAPVWIVELSDFECPYCKRWHDEVYPAIKRDYVDKGIVRMAYLHFPLSMHRHAKHAAAASLCSAEQNKFWPMHDKLFQTQKRWAALENPAALFDSLAVAAGASGPAWRACMREGLVDRVINGDVSRGQSIGMRSTPTFFVGDEPIVGAAPLADFRAAIERQRAKAAKKP
jgi:protein-disulfide isomerase